MTKQLDIVYYLAHILSLMYINNKRKIKYSINTQNYFKNITPRDETGFPTLNLTLSIYYYHTLSNVAYIFFFFVSIFPYTIKYKQLIHPFT